MYVVLDMEKLRRKYKELKLGDGEAYGCSAE
jgi:hypothetical protein